MSPAPRNLPERQPARNVQMDRLPIPHIYAHLERQLELAREERKRLEAKRKKKGR